MLIVGGFSLSKGLLDPGSEKSLRKPKLTLYCRWFHRCCHPTGQPRNTHGKVYSDSGTYAYNACEDTTKKWTLTNSTWEDWHTYALLRAGTLSTGEPPPSQFIQLSLQPLCTLGDHEIQSTIIIFHSSSSSKCPKYWEDWATDQQRGVLWHDDNGVSCVSLSMAQGHVRASKGTRLVLKDCPG